MLRKMLNSKTIIPYALAILFCGWIVYDSATHHLPEQKAENGLALGPGESVVVAIGNDAKEEKKQDEFCFNYVTGPVVQKHCIPQNEAISMLAEKAGVYFYKTFESFSPSEVVLLEKEKE